MAVQTMKTTLFAFTPPGLLAAALLGFTGCGSTPVNPLATQQSPALAGGIPVIKTFDAKGVVTSVVPSQRTLALQTDAGHTLNCKVAPEVSNLDQVQVGTRVRVAVTDATAIFPTKNATPPSAGAGVSVSGPPEAGQSRAVVLQTTDYPGKATKVDRSYRLLTVEEANGRTREYKASLPHTLENVEKGDEVVVRTTQPLVLRLESK
jgi:hypothetical protein